MVDENVRNKGKEKVPPWGDRPRIDMFHVFVLAYPLPKLVFCDPPLMTSHLGNCLPKKCLWDLEKIPSFSLGPGA